MKKRRPGVRARLAIVIAALAIAAASGVGAALYYGLIGPRAERIAAAEAFLAEIARAEAFIDGALAPELDRLIARRGGCAYLQPFLGAKPEIDVTLRSNNRMLLCEATPRRLDGFLPRRLQGCPPVDRFGGLSRATRSGALDTARAVLEASQDARIGAPDVESAAEVFAYMIERHLSMTPSQSSDGLEEALAACVFEAELPQARLILAKCGEDAARAILRREDPARSAACRDADATWVSFGARLPTPFAR